MKTLKTPQTVTLTDTIASYAVRGSYDKQKQLRRFRVFFLNEKGKPIHPALAPREQRVTTVTMDAILATPKLSDSEKDQDWLERATAPYIEKMYGLTV